MSDIIIGDKYEVSDEGRVIKIDTVTVEALREMLRSDKVRKQEYSEYEEMDDESEELKSETPSKSAKPKQEKDLNYFQTGRFLKAAVEGEWFEELRVDKKFTRAWIATLVDQLLESKWRDLLAQTWENKNKRAALKGYFIGCLVDAEVLKGTYDGIARAIGYDASAYRTFSKNMGRGKCQPYFDWVRDYVNTHQE